jgi:hypothetical protein
MKTHGHSPRGKFSPEYRAWSNMIQRCTNSNNPHYQNYGKRGIKVCKEWMEFAAFIKDMGKRPKGLMLERKDNDAGYSPQNCIWADRMTQNNNSRNNVKNKICRFT